MGKSRKTKQRQIIIIIIGILVCLGIYWFMANQKTEKRNVVKIYFLRGDKLIEVERDRLPKEPPLEKALKELLKGPSQKEKRAGITTQIPDGTKVNGIMLKEDLAIVNFNNKIEEYGGGSNRLRGMIAQIVYTATALPEIEKVWLWEEGNKELVLGGEGLVLDRPLSRSEIDF